MRGVNDGHNYSKEKPNAPKTQWAKPLRVSEWIRPLEAINAGEYMPHIDFVHVVVFVGMPGSGKSTASRLLLELAAQAPAAAGQWTRISQDELGGRKACEVSTYILSYILSNLTLSPHQIWKAAAACQLF